VHSDVFLSVVNFLIGLAEALGVIAVGISLVLGLSPYVATLVRHRTLPSIGDVRTRLGRGLVFSLEIFIAADLLRSVLSPTLEDVGVLALTTLIRIALSLSLDFELKSASSGEGQESLPSP
jgi:uncharacterized membrane protein